MSFTVGAWVFPAFITIAAFWLAIAKIPDGRGDYDFSPLIGCALLPIAGCVSLLAWLVWALV